MSGDPVRSRLIAAELARVDGTMPGDGPLQPKHRRMAASPFRFLRGAAQLYYADLASGELALPAPLLRPPLTRVQGDCHFANFGLFTEEGSHGDRVVFAPNDFDDAAVAPAGFDLLRLCTSVFLVADLCRGLAEGRYRSQAAAPGDGARAPSQQDAARACRGFLDRYRDTCRAMHEDASERDHALCSFPDKHVLARPLAKARRRAAGGKRFASKSSLGKAAQLVAGRLRFRDRPGRFERPPEDEARTVREVFRPYVDDEIVDLVRRVGAGTGSMNVDRYYLLVGPCGEIDEAEIALAHVVEVKLQREAAMLHHFPDLSPVNTLNPAHLTVDCQRQMVRRPDLILDEVYWRDGHWLVRSRHHARLSLDPEELLGTEKPKRALRQYAAACGRTLARAHARGDRRSTRFEQAMAQALETSRDALVDTAARYAERTVADHMLLRETAGLSRAG